MQRKQSRLVVAVSRKDSKGGKVAWFLQCLNALRLFMYLLWWFHAKTANEAK